MIRTTRLLTSFQSAIILMYGLPNVTASRLVIFTRLFRDADMFEGPREITMSIIQRLCAILLLLGVPVSFAQAQWGGWGGGYSYHSSTLEEGIQRGAADVIRSQGMANLMNAQAAGQFEQARSQYLDNRLKATQTYFEMRRYNTEARQAARATPLSLEQYVRLARDQAPDPLTATQLDSLTGNINWPALLRQAEYQTLRERLDKLFQDRANGYVNFSEIQQACQDFNAQLKANLTKYTPNDYISAKKFLDSLAFAARGVQS